MSEAWERRRVQMDGLAARWEAADGLGPLPGTHAFERAEARDDAPSAAGALHVAGRSVSVREERFSAGETGGARGGPGSLPSQPEMG